VNFVEAVTVCHVTQEEDQELQAISDIKTESNNYRCFVEGAAGSCIETSVICDVDGTEGVSIKFEETIDSDNEVPETIRFSPIKTEHEGTLQ
jgi:hypothetical protein